MNNVHTMQKTKLRSQDYTSKLHWIQGYNRSCCVLWWTVNASLNYKNTERMIWSCGEGLLVGSHLNKRFSSVNRLVLLQYKFWFCLLLFILLSIVTVTPTSAFTATADAVPVCDIQRYNSMVLQDRRMPRPATASVVLILITSTILFSMDLQ